MAMLRLGVIVLAIFLSGCFGADESPSDDGSAATGDAVPDTVSIDRPTWAVGHWWSYAGSEGETRTWVVTEASGAYVVDVTAEDFAFTDAALSDISTIGAVSLDLDGSQDGTAVAFFDWPLTDGKTWSLEWDGMPFEATAAVTPDLASITAVSGDTVRTYTYDVAAGWFGSIESTVNGTVEWGMGLVASGADFAGRYVRYEIHDEERLVFDPTSGQQDAGDLEVPDDATDVWYDLDLTCVSSSVAPGMIHYLLQPPSPTTKGLLVSSACPVTIDSTETLEAETGTWRTVVDAQGIEGTITVIVRTLHEYTL